ncbi:MAG TPA: protein kinase [Chloroflexota bacterium]|nr:protein kinase [Chloroflexota bacterium]
MDLTGRHLGKYELLERLGQGGMAYVYKAHQPTIDRFVAVKVLHSHLADDAEFRERFKREAKGLGSLRHPHIMSVIDFDVDDGWYYMVMDYIEGDTLEAYLDQRGRLPLAEALRLMEQLTGALAYAHGHGRIHRDIKPGNVMFADANHQHAVLTDFGLTRLLDNTTLTISGTIAGTPAYMSPEAAQGQKVDGRSDIYSLGVMLFEMVTGQRPYAGDTPLSVIMKLVLEPLPPARSVNPDLPPALDDMLHKAMTKLPKDRYQTMAEMQQALATLRRELDDVGAAASQPALMAEPVILGTQLLPQPALPPLHLPRPAAKVKKRPWLPLLAGMGVLLVLTVVGFTLLRGGGKGKPEVRETAVPTLTSQEATAPLATAVPTPTAAGSLRFAEPDSHNLRQYTLSLDDVPLPPDGSHYELWFDFANQPAPENVARVVAQNGRITYADVLVDSLATDVTAVRISLEPDADDDPAISADVVFTGTVTAETGLAQILLFATSP